MGVASLKMEMRSLCIHLILCLTNAPSKTWPRNSANIHKNREKNFQFFGVNDFKIRCRVFEIKFIKGKNFNEKQIRKLKKLAKKFYIIPKNREKKLEFFGVNDFKIRWTVLEIKFIKGKNFNEKRGYVN